MPSATFLTKAEKVLVLRAAALGAVTFAANHHRCNTANPDGTTGTTTARDAHGPPSATRLSARRHARKPKAAPRLLARLPPAPPAPPPPHLMPFCATAALNPPSLDAKLPAARHTWSTTLHTARNTTAARLHAAEQTRLQALVTTRIVMERHANMSDYADVNLTCRSAKVRRLCTALANADAQENPVNSDTLPRP